MKNESQLRPQTWRVSSAIAKITFLEIVRDKVLYNILVCSVLLFGIGFLVSQLTFVRPERVVLDFSVSAVSISCAMIAIFVGAGMIGREFERRTIGVALSHPISRPQFVFGKFLGIAMVLALNWVLLLIALGALLLSSGLGLGAVASMALVWACVLLLLQAFVLASIAVFFSTFSTTSLSVIMSVGVYLVGSSISEIRTVAEKVQSPVVLLLLRTASAVLPNFVYFRMGTQVTYGLPVDAMFIVCGLLYGVVLCVLFILSAGLLIRRREV